MKQNKELESRVAQLEGELLLAQQRERQLAIRLEELNYLYALGELLTESNVTREALLQSAVDKWPFCRQEFGELSVFIEFDGKEYSQKDSCDCTQLQKTNAEAAVDIVVHGKKSGFVQIYASGSDKDPKDGAFGDQLKNLVTTAARMISQYMDRALAQKFYSESQEFLQEVLKASSVGISYTKDRKIIWANEAMQELFAAQQPDDYIGQDTSILFADKEEYHRVGKMVYDRNPDVAVMNYDTTFVRCDGTEFIGFVRINRLKPHDPRKGVIVSIIDITERKQAEQKSQYLLEFKNLLMKLSSHFINVPLKKIDLAIDQSLAEMGEFVGADRAYIFDYDFDRQICINTFEWCREGIKAQQENLQAVPLTQIPNWVNAHVQGDNMNIPDVFDLPHKGLRQILEEQDIKSLLTIPLMRGGFCIGFVGFDSVSGHYRYSEDEKQLLEVYAEMLVNSLERQEMERELVKAKDKAEESDRLKSAFLANMSHEIRTPMNGIMGFTELLREPNLTGEKQRKYLDIIRKSGERMLNTVNDLIDLSRIETGQVTILSEPTDINQQIQVLWNFFRPEAEQKSLRFELESLPPKEEVTTDKNKVDSIFTNLIKNAIKYTDQGSVTVGGKKDKNSLIYYVRDTGIGIPAHRQEAIFNRFEQADIGNRRAFQGAGLGLAIAKAYVHMLGGEIWVDSEEGVGSTFWVSLPISSEDQDRESSFVDNNASGVLSPKAKVLVAEDDDISFQYIKEILEGYSLDLLRAYTGTEAMDLCQQNPDIALILMDMKMPHSDGYNATRAIRGFNQKVTIIAQTAYALAGDREKALAAGCDDYLVKPIQKEKLLAKMTIADHPSL